ncbi:MAG: hypothetical protein M4579_003824 [Chaenotheca gracillima]|nr:MAG: hypothetical protein M4579_003824 [Chaenotheca gracillima]
MSLNKSILLLGAGGLGMAMLRALSPMASKNTTSLAILLRPATIESQDPLKKQQIVDIREDASIVPGDLVENSEDELALLFAPFHTVVGCTGYASGQNIQVKLARAVLKAGVSRYFPWQFGVDYEIIGRGSAQDLFDEQLDVRDMLRDQDRTEWVIVSTGMFTSFLFEPWFGVVDMAEHTVRALGDWDNAVTVTTPEDIGSITAQILFAEPRLVNEVVYTASDTVTYGRLAEIVEAVSGHQVHKVRWSVPSMKKALAQDPQDGIKKYRVVFGEGKGVSWSLEETFNHRKGIPVTGVEQWARSSLS